MFSNLFELAAHFKFKIFSRHTIFWWRHIKNEIFKISVKNWLMLNFKIFSRHTWKFFTAHRLANTDINLCANFPSLPLRFARIHMGVVSVLVSKALSFASLRLGIWNMSFAQSIRTSLELTWVSYVIYIKNNSAYLR